MEAGYSISLEELPDQELTFALSTSAHPKKIQRIDPITQQLSLMATGVLLILILAVFGLLTLIKHRKEKKAGAK